MRFNTFYLSKSKGFTLIETIVGIVVLAISFSLITTLIFPLTEQSADQLHQIRAAELGQSMLNEIQNKAFDEKSDKAGGIIRCGESGVTCTTNADLGADGTEARKAYDDVDDYNGLRYGIKYGEGDIADSQEEIISLYLGYSMAIDVCNDGNYDGTCDNTTDVAKKITVTVTTPTGFDIVFSTYRANF